MNEHDPFSPEHLRLPPEVAARARAATPKAGKVGQARRPTSGFTKFPKTWQARLAAAHAPGSAYRLALRLLDLAWRTDNRTFTIGNAALTKLGVGRRGKRAGLKALEKAGLVLIERQHRKSPAVTLLLPDG